MKKQYSVFWTAISVALIFGCSDPSSNKSESIEEVDSSSELVVEANIRQVDFSDAADFFAQSARSSANNMLVQCSDMQAQIDAFIAKPTDQSQTAAQETFTSCYQLWQSASVYFQVPFELSEAKSFVRMMDLIDTRPFVPGYIDGIPEYPFSGLVNEIGMEINRSNLRGQHRLMDEESASLGFPIIEFFLWRTPVQGNWISGSSEDDQKAFERRFKYLNTATSYLIEELSNATLRWQTQGKFQLLPESAQLTYVLKSIQRISMVTMLAESFDDGVLEEPHWYHPAIISGNGLTYPQRRLEGLEQLFTAKESQTVLSNWVDKLENAPVSSAQLIDVIHKAQIAIDKLPSNYPLETKSDDTWQSARQSIAELALLLSQLSTYHNITVLTD